MGTRSGPRPREVGAAAGGTRRHPRLQFSLAGWRPGVRGPRHRLSPIDDGLFRILQSGDPWRVLATGCLLKVTRKEQVYPLLQRFFRRYATADRLVAGDLRALRRLLYPLGLWRKRALELRRMARRLVSNGPPQKREEAEALYGVGEYVADCYALFVLRDYSRQPRDYALRHYWRTLQRPKPGT